MCFRSAVVVKPHQPSAGAASRVNPRRPAAHQGEGGSGSCQAWVLKDSEEGLWEARTYSGFGEGERGLLSLSRDYRQLGLTRDWVL